MPIQTTVEGTARQVRAVTTWLRSSYSAATDDYATTLVGVRSTAGSGWEGAASENSQTVIRTVGARADDIAETAVRFANEFDHYAYALETVQSTLVGVRSRAGAAGLALTTDTILEPGRAPVVPPRPAPHADSATTTAYNAAALSAEAHGLKVEAYNAAVDDAEHAYQIFEDALAALGGVIADEMLDLLNWADVAILATEETFTRYRSSVTAAIDNYRLEAQRANDAYLRQPGGTPEARFQEKLRFEANRSADDLIRHADELDAGRLARLFGGKLPVVGTIVTIAGIGYDISTGTPPSSAIVGGIAGAAGTALAVAGVAALGGGPVGWVVAAGIVGGVVVGLGAQWAWENWVPADVRAKIDQGIEDAWNASTDWVGDRWDDATGWVGDTWDAIF